MNTGLYVDSNNNANEVPLQADLGGAAKVAAPRTISVPVTPTITAGAYADGQCVGGIITLTNFARSGVGSGLIQMVEAMFTTAVTPTLDFIFFDADPSAGSTITDNVAFSLAAAHTGKVIGTAQINNWTSLGTPRQGQSVGPALPFAPLPGGSTTAYLVIVTRSAFTPAASGLTIKAKVLPD